MLLRFVAALAALPLGLCAQGVRLCERIEAPMAYVSMDVGAVAASADGSGHADPEALRRLLGATSMLGLLDSGPAAAAFAFVRGVLGRAQGEIELALVGVLPATLSGGDGAGTPLVVVRTRLSPTDAERMRAVLADAAVARPMRTVQGHATFELVGHEEPAKGGTPGGRLEAVVVGDDLVVANNSRGIDEALDDRTTATPRGLLGDARYVRLMARLGPSPGSIVAFADWRRFGPRLASIGGVSGALLAWSGLGGADAVAAAVAAHRVDGATSGLQSTILLSFPPGAELDGWLAMIEAAPARQLVDELPVGGLGGVVFAVEPRRVVEAAGRASGFGTRVAGACGDCGLDLARIVRRLGQRGALQLLFLPGSTVAVAPAFALQAQNRKAASDIVDEIARALDPSPRGSDRNPPHVALRGVGGLERLQLGAVDDLLVFAKEAGAVAALAAARRERSRVRPQVDADVTAALRAFHLDRGSRMGGLVHLDLGPMLPAAAVPAAGADADLRSEPPSTELPFHHTGLIDIETADQRTLIRLQLLSTR